MEWRKMKHIVISGINIRKLGTLSIFYEILEDLIDNRLFAKYKITLMVSSKDLFKKYDSYFEIIDFPEESKSRIRRYYYEYFWFKQYSEKNEIFAWISINDKTPNVMAEHQILYCHNATMFYKCSLKEILISYTIFLYSILYPFLYRLNIHKNDFVIVQQHWIAKEFEKRFKLNNVLVMKPKGFTKAISSDVQDMRIKESMTTFIYPTSAKSFKNCEVICEASKILNKNTDSQYRVLITISGNENKYAKMIYKKYKDDNHIQFCGFLNYEKLQDQYKTADCLIFPSKLETWGLPLTEFSEYRKSILVSDLKYAHETLNGYEYCEFFDPDDSIRLSQLMKRVINGEIVSSKNVLTLDPTIEIQSISNLISRLENT